MKKDNQQTGNKKTMILEKEHMENPDEKNVIQKQELSLL